MRVGYTTGKLALEARGQLPVKKKDILKFRPELEPLLEEVSKKGWIPTLTDVKGAARATIELDKASYIIHQEQPGCADEATQTNIIISLGEEMPSMAEVTGVHEVKVNIATKNCWRAATLDPGKNEVVYVRDLFWNWDTTEPVEGKRLLEFQDVRDVVKWATEEKKYRLGKHYSKAAGTIRYAPERFKQLEEALEHPVEQKIPQ